MGNYAGLPKNRMEEDQSGGVAGPGSPNNLQGPLGPVLNGGGSGGPSNLTSPMPPPLPMPSGGSPLGGNEGFTPSPALSSGPLSPLAGGQVIDRPPEIPRPQPASVPPVTSAPPVPMQQPMQQQPMQRPRPQPQRPMLGRQSGLGTSRPPSGARARPRSGTFGGGYGGMA